MNCTFLSRARFAWYLVAAAMAGLLLCLVAPILSQFLFAAILARICLPRMNQDGDENAALAPGPSARALSRQRSS